MRLPSVPALAFAATLAAAAPATAAQRKAHAAHAALATHAGGAVALSYPGRPGARVGGRRSGHYAELVGDPDGGAGFYPLPWAIRAGAWRERQRRAWSARDAISFAVMSQQIYAYATPYAYGPHHPGVFNPWDGYGTPFFAGYYGPAGDPGAARGPFGNAYRN